MDDLWAQFAQEAFREVDLQLAMLEGYVEMVEEMRNTQGI